ncbi:hypothetical protein ATANTOWER_024648 [Ataeniobius toweri]|uniref:BRCT domain-containing protein n=1 Tax=Ataeniobius toweri TaxID=208326 RepID=A0ABU7ACT6_9TELE|nr:hypothetical protein [Ataeniobius toweri]
MTSSKHSSVLKDVVAYVDVWSSDKRANYSNPFIQQLEEMGAQVSKRLNKQVTHVVFNNGHQATWRKAKKMDVQLVSVLWVGRCYDGSVRVDEKLFPALNDEKNPVMKNRKHRCMLPKDSPERTTENDWRLKKKFEKMVKDLPPLEPQVVDMSPIIIDEENRIIYSPALNRSDYMAQRLKDMKDEWENISPTASQMADSCSPTGVKPSLGSTPTFLKFNNDESDDAFVAEPDGSPAKEEGRSSDAGDRGQLGRDSTKPWLSPCHDVPQRSESGGNECTIAAGFTENTSVTEENHNKQAGLSLQKMVNKTKIQQDTHLPKSSAWISQILLVRCGFLLGTLPWMPSLNHEH